MPAAAVLFGRHLSSLTAMHRRRRIHGAEFVIILLFRLKHVHALCVLYYTIGHVRL